MFNLNESNRIIMSQHPTDMHMGVNSLNGQVRMIGHDPLNCDVYISVGKSRQVMKILYWEYGGSEVYCKRLEEGRFHPRIFLCQGVGFRSVRWSEPVLLMDGISPKVARRHRYEKDIVSEPKCSFRTEVQKVLEIAKKHVYLHPQTRSPDGGIGRRVGLKHQ